MTLIAPTRYVLLFGGILALFAACLSPVQAAAYGQGTYYSESSYYAQGYYQGSYASLSSLITAVSYVPGAGGYAPNSYTYWGGGGGGGLVLNGSTVGGAASPGSPGNGGLGYGGGGGGSDYTTAGGAGAPGVVYVEWDAAPASCSVSFSANPIQYGQTATLSWTSSYADTYVYIRNVGYVGVSGSVSVGPSTTTDYSCYAQGELGSDGWHTYSLVVNTPPSPTAHITSSSGSTISLGDSTTISATFAAGTGDTLTADNIDSPEGTGLGADTNPTSPKSITFTPAHAGTFTFYARATTNYYSSWTTYATTTVTVTAPCILDGVTLQSGESQTFYSSQTATAGGLCSDYTQTRTCTDGVLSGSATYQYASCTCAPSYSCSGQSIISTDSACNTSTVTTCSSPYMCSPGVSTCVSPDPSFNSDDAGFTGHLQVQPQIVPRGFTTKVHWDVSNVSSCSVSGTNGDSWTGLSSGSDGKTTSPILAQTTYTLHCVPLGGTFDDEDAVVNIIPIFQEL